MSTSTFILSAILSLYLTAQRSALAQRSTIRLLGRALTLTTSVGAQRAVAEDGSVVLGLRLRGRLGGGRIRLTSQLIAGYGVIPELGAGPSLQGVVALELRVVDNGIASLWVALLVRGDNTLVTRIPLDMARCEQHLMLRGGF